MKNELNVQLGILFLLLIACPVACSEKEKEGFLFERIPSSESGINFINKLNYNEQVNPYTFRNFYNGAGVALGDINNDGLLDIFFSGNQVSNKLYLNKGDFKFEDISSQAGIENEGVWSTGVSMVDVNGDGWLDIFVCKSGPPGGKDRHNQLFINNKDNTFTDLSHEYGLADEGLSQHAVFFDYDLDGDLDMYLLNNSLRSVGIYDLREGQREVRDSLGGNKLYRNDGGIFKDVSEEAGIYGSAIGYGLGVTVSDVNQDGWPDLYVSNDFFEKDYLYLNNQDGTFREALEDVVQETSLGAMGADIADLNNNGWPDIFVTEMLPEDWARVKTKTPFESWDKYQASVSAGYFHQFARNTLQQHLGYIPGTKQVHFSEVSRMAGVHATDWSWGALIFDADNDGHKDIFVANGIAKDLTDFDYVDFFVDDQRMVSALKKDSILLTSLIDQFPSFPISNYFFRNKGDFVFENAVSEWGMSQPGFSNGAAYGDLDNDGDLDLVVSNINQEVFIYRNQATQTTGNHFLQLELGGHFGTKVNAFAGGDHFFSEHYPVKGYMSSGDHKLHLGLGPHEMLDSLHIIWPGGRIQKMSNVPTDQVLKPDPGHSAPLSHADSPDLEAPWLEPAGFQVPHTHLESEFIDFDRDRLRFWMISNEGPRMAVGDINGDGLDDILIPGAKNQATSLWLQSKEGSFLPHQENLFLPDSLAEDVAAHFFDANGDGFLDLYVASGSIEFGNGTPIYQDRLYLNDGSGHFIEAKLPTRFQNTAFVKSFDYNKDGHLDILIGGRSIPTLYGLPVDMAILQNDGNGGFKEVNMPGFKEVGMARDAWIEDLDGDGEEEIILVGEWMSIKMFKKKNGQYVDTSIAAGFENTQGLWQCLVMADFNGNGHPDLMVGNWGLNSRMLASQEVPLQMLVNDFDGNGSVEHLLAKVVEGQRMPLVMKTDLLKQLPSLRKQLKTYEDYRKATLESLFPVELLDKSLKLEAKTLETQLFLNDGKGKFTPAKLPRMAQSGPVYSILAKDLNGNGLLDVVLGGNQSKVKPEFGTQMGSYGQVLENKGNGAFEWVEPSKSGVYVPGEIRSINSVKTREGNALIIGRNNSAPLIFNGRFKD